MPLTCTSMLTTLCRYYLLRCDCDPNVKGLKEFNKDLKIAVLRSNLYKVTNFAKCMHSSDYHDSGSRCRPSPWLWQFPSTPLSSVPSPHLATGNHYEAFCLYSYNFSRISYKQNGTAYILLPDFFHLSS